MTLLPVALELYNGHPNPALLLAYQLTTLSSVKICKKAPKNDGSIITPPNRALAIDLKVVAARLLALPGLYLASRLRPKMRIHLHKTLGGGVCLTEHLCTSFTVSTAIEEYHENIVIRCRDHFLSVPQRNDPDANVRKQARWALDLRDLKMGKRINER